LVLLLVFYSSFYTPYQAAYHSKVSSTRYVDYVVDLCFWADMAITFWTGYDKGFDVVMDKAMIVKHYLKTWFVLDFVATMDWEWVHETIYPPNTEGTQNNLPPVVSLLRLLKVLRLARAGRIIKRLTMTWTLHTRFIDAFNFFLYVFVVCHLLACLFFLLPELTACVPDQEAADKAFLEPDSRTEGWLWERNGPTCLQNSWRQIYGLEEICKPCRENTTFLLGDDTCASKWANAAGGAGSHYPQDTKYVLRVCQETVEFDYEEGTQHVWGRRKGVPSSFYDTRPYNETFIAKQCPKCMTPLRLWFDSMYWSLTTMTTIGYGDRGPNTEYELIFVMFAEISGLTFFAILLTQINTVNEVLGEEQQLLNDQKNGVVSLPFSGGTRRCLCDELTWACDDATGAILALSRPAAVPGDRVSAIPELSRHGAH
jgi:hypothetical protein